MDAKVFLRKLAMGAAAAAIAAGAGPLTQAAQVPAYVTAAVQDVGRPPADFAQDAQRKPAAVIAFAGVRPGQKVAIIGDAHGYYARILSKLVGPRGRVYDIVADVFGLAGGGNGKAPPAAVSSNEPAGAELLAIQNIAEYGNLLVLVESFGNYGGSVALPEPVDVVWSVGADHKLRALFNRVGSGVTMAAVDRAIFRAIKPGGMLIEIDNASGSGADATALGRSDEATVRSEVQAAGFTPAGQSRLLADAADDHAKPVDDAASAGPLDRFVLRFIKPANSAPDHRPPVSAMKPYFGNTFVLGTPTARFRTIFYHSDHSYQEFGMHDMQSATWWFDADGQNCMLHEFPARQRGLVICHPFEDVHRAPPIGRPFVEHGGGGAGMTVSVVPGHQYPNVSGPPRVAPPTP